MDFTIKELAEITKADIIKSGVLDGFRYTISTDSRDIDAEKIFLPIVGENFDGHDFIEAAVKKGVTAYFTEKDIIINDAKWILKVGDTKEAYLQIANYYKRRINPKTIAITGSAGKTTTKEMAYSIFSRCFKTHKSQLNHNNEIGLAQTLLSMPRDTEVLIVEMGMRGLGEIELLSKYAEPDIAIITNIGSAHIGRLGSIENIAKAKYEITKHLKTDGMLIAHKNEHIEKMNSIKDRTLYFSLSSKDLKGIDLNAEYSEFIYKGVGYRINLSGEYNIQNALSVIEAAICYGISFNKIKEGLENFNQIENRWQKDKVLEANIINDSYNANPESMIATIKNFLAVHSGRKILVLGDMGELGKHEALYHKELGEKIKNLKYDLLITIGKLSKYISDIDTARSIHFTSVEACSYYLKNNLQKGDWVLLKASRSMELEKIIKNLKEVDK